MDYAEMMKKKNNYSMIVFTVTIIVGLAVFALGVYPLYKAAVSTTTEANKKSAELTELKNKKKILDALKDKEDELKKNAEVVSSALPEKKDVGSLFIQVDALVNQSGGKVHSITGSAQASSGTSTGFTGIQKYTYSIPATFTSYASMKSFIQNSKNALRLLNIDDVNVVAPDSGNLDTTINITAYARN